MLSILRKLMIGMSIVILSTGAYSASYYLNTMIHDAGMVISVNGIPINIDEPESSTSAYIGQFIIDGVNRIDVTYIPAIKANPMSYAKWTLVSVPDGKKMLSPETQILANGEFRPREADITLLSPDNFTPLAGSKDPKGTLHFQSNGKRVRFCGRLNGDAVLLRLPSQLGIDGLNMTIKNAHVDFMKRDTHIKVSYSNITLQEGAHDITLVSDMLSYGRQWINETGFDEILIEGEIAGEEAVATPTVKRLIFRESMSVFHEEKKVTISSDNHWDWQDGDKYTMLSTEDKALLWKEVQRMYDALSQKDFGQIRELLSLKTAILSRITHQDSVTLETDQKRSFVELFADPDWNLAPLQSDNIEYILLNPQIVTIKTVDRENIISSLPSTNGKDFEFRFPLYFAHIRGEWVIIW